MPEARRGYKLQAAVTCQVSCSWPNLVPDQEKENDDEPISYVLLGLKSFFRGFSISGAEEFSRTSSASQSHPTASTRVGIFATQFHVKLFLKYSRLCARA